MNQEFLTALSEVAEEKGISSEILIDAIEQALIAAYKKNYGHADNVKVTFDRESGEIKVFQQKTIMDEVIFPEKEIGLAEARGVSPDYKIGDVIDFEVTPRSFGRIAAQTAKQVVVQRIKEAERDMVYDAYSNRENALVTGVIVRQDKNNIVVQIENDTEAVLPQNEQLPGEYYPVGVHMKFYISDVKIMGNNTQVILSRTHPNLVRKLFEQEVPEIGSGIVEIKTISREAGSRSKISVYSSDENVDPVGSCVGPRGSRVQLVCDELGGEKIDIVRYSDDPAQFIQSALSPSEVVSVTVDEEAKAASVLVPGHQLSLAIGKEGQNARLAARLTGWKIDIKAAEA